MGKYLRSRARRGASDLIVVLALIAVAIPVALAVQNWLTSQVGKIATYSVAPALVVNVLSMEYRGSNATALIRLTNTGSSDVNLSAGIRVMAVFENGTTASTLVDSVTRKTLLRPGDEEILVTTLTGVSSRVTTLVIEVRDVAGKSYLAEARIR